MIEDDKEVIKILVQENPEFFVDQFEQFQSLMMMYRAAIREVTTKFEVLDDELSLNQNKNPILSIQSRVKKPISIAGKLKSLEKEVTLEEIVTSLNDVAGIRVICSFIDDIYQVADMLACQDDIKVLKVKDYIQNPKPNGYRSYHMIVEVPVYFSKGKVPMRVEIQIRTLAMDFWASLEHRMKYKRDVKNPEIINRELAKCAEVISKTDEHMMHIKDLIESERKEKDEV